MNTGKGKKINSLQVITLEVFAQVFGDRINPKELSELQMTGEVSIHRDKFAGHFYLTGKGIIAVKCFSGNPLLDYYGPMGVWELTQKNLDNHLSRLNRLRSFIYPSRPV